MVISENEVEKQIRNMTAFIHQEANEKVEEIEAKTEEEYQIEKNKVVQEQRHTIVEYYNKKYKQVQMSKKIQNSNLLNNAKLKILQSKQQHISNLMEKANNELVNMTQNTNKYSNTLKLLIEQGLFQLLEKEVIIRCRKQDISLVEKAVSLALESYKQATRKNVNVTIDKNVFLENVIGGIELLTLDGKIRIINTLDSRLKLMGQQMIPELRDTLFGTNTNRKFKD